MTNPKHIINPSPVAEQLRTHIESLLNSAGIRHGNDTDVQFYSSEAWDARGEYCGNAAELSMIFEGALYRIINNPFDQSDRDLASLILTAGEQFGLQASFGFAWSLHFYAR